MKTKEELNAIKEEVETLNKKLAELTEEELAQVSGGGSEMMIYQEYCKKCGYVFIEEKIPEGTLIPAGDSDDKFCPHCQDFVPCGSRLTVFG